MTETFFTFSAFRHGIPESDFFEVLARKYLKFRSGRRGSGKYEVIGRNAAGEYRHFVYQVLPDGGRRVFHMMPADERHKRLYRKRYRL